MDADKFPLTGSMPVDDMKTFKFIGFYPAAAPIPVRRGVSLSDVRRQEPISR